MPVMKYQLMMIGCLCWVCLACSGCASSRPGNESADDTTQNNGEDTVEDVSIGNDIGDDTGAPSDIGQTETGVEDLSGTEDTGDNDRAGTDDSSDDSAEELFLREGLGDNEWADCFVPLNCVHDDFVLLSLDDIETYDGYLGEIDDSAHYYEATGDTPWSDIDFLGISIPGSASGPMLMEFTVEPDDGQSLIDPVLSTWDGFKIMTVNRDRGSDDTRARTVIVNPYTTGFAFYVLIEDQVNEARYYDGGPWVGGNDYGYILRIDLHPFEPIDLGELSSTTSPITRAGQQLVDGGDIHYYSVAVTGGSPTVTVQRTGSSAFVMYLAAMDNVNEVMFWNRVTFDGVESPGDGAEDGVLSLSGSAFDRCGDTCIFAVTDWNGASHPGAFTYDLTVTLE